MGGADQNSFDESVFERIFLGPSEDVLDEATENQNSAPDANQTSTKTAALQDLVSPEAVEILKTPDCATQYQIPDQSRKVSSVPDPSARQTGCFSAIEGIVLLRSKSQISPAKALSSNKLLPNLELIPSPILSNVTPKNSTENEFSNISDCSNIEQGDDVDVSTSRAGVKCSKSSASKRFVQAEPSNSDSFESTRPVSSSETAENRPTPGELCQKFVLSPIHKATTIGIWLPALRLPETSSYWTIW